jgi:hypothetical protein
LEFCGDLQRHKEVYRFASGEWECQRERTWNVADSPIERQLAHRSDRTPPELKLTTRRKDAECDRQIKRTSTLP